MNLEYADEMKSGEGQEWGIDASLFDPSEKTLFLFIFLLIIGCKIKSMKFWKWVILGPFPLSLSQKP